MKMIPIEEPLEGLTNVILISKGRMYSTTIFTEDAKKVEKIAAKASKEAGRKLAKIARERHGYRKQVRVPRQCSK